MASRRVWIGLLVTVGFLALVFRRVELGELRAAFLGAAYWLLVPAVAVYFLAFWLRALRWRLLLSSVGPVGVGRAYWVATIGYAVNNVLPLRVGELVRSYLLRRRPGVSATGALATIAVERVLDGLTLLSWLAPILLLKAAGGEASVVLRLVLQGSALLFGGVALTLAGVVLFPSRALRALEALLRPLPGRWTSSALGMARALVDGFAVLRRGRLLLALLLLSQGIWVGEAILYLFVAGAVGLDASLVALGAAVAASNLATSIPSSSGGIGPFELLAKESLVLFGVAPSLALAYALLVHATLVVPVTALGFAFLLAEGVSLREAVRTPSSPAASAGEERKG